MYGPNLMLVTLPVPEIIAIVFWVGVAKVGKGKAVRGRGWYRSKERW